MSEESLLESRYTILAMHAKGGLGMISLAQDRQLPRQVALKEIQQEHDGSVARSRFVTEAQLTGSLEHPGIVPVYSFGEFPDGRPFYAMRFISGRSLAQAIDELHSKSAPAAQESTLPFRRSVTTETALAAKSQAASAAALPTRAAIDFASLEFRQHLSRFVAVCHAVDYAHSRGVIHRDLKPSNIMLGDFGETLVVDWGLARSLSGPAGPSEGRSGGEGTETQQGDIIGTPAYMSPEQAAGRADQVNCASDIYSLGASLYHIVTGSPPLHGTPIKELLVKVRSGQIPAPRALQPRVPRALEMICAKAMNVSPEARYGSARELAEEVERFLADEPVEAWPEPVPARLARFGRKHRAVVRIAAIAMALIATGATVAAVRENRLRTTASEAHEARKEALEREADQAEIARQRAAEAIAQSDYTNTYAEFLVHEVLTAPRPEGIHSGRGVHITVKQALDAARPRIAQRFAGKPLAEALIRHAAGITYTYLSEFDTAIGELEQAHALFQRHAEPGDSQLDQCAQNLAAAYAAGGKLQLAIPLLEQIVEGDQVTLTNRLNLAQAYLSAGRAEEAILQYQTAIEAARNDRDLPAEQLLQMFGGLASAYQRGGRPREAIEKMQTLLAQMESELPPGHAHLITLISNLGLAHHDLRQFDEAHRHFQRARQESEQHLGADHHLTLMSLQNLASNLRDKGQPAEAIPLLEQAVQRMTARFTAQHYDTLGAMNNLALAYWNAKRADDAVALFDQTLRLRIEHLGPQQADTLISFENLIVVAAALASGGNPDRAAELGNDVLLLARQSLPEGHPKIVRAMIMLASTLKAMPGREPESIKLLEDAVGVRKDHPDPADPGATEAMNALATILRAVKRPDDATPVFEEILAVREELFPPGHEKRLMASWNLGAHLQEQGNFARAEELLLAVHTELEKSPSAVPALVPHIVPRMVSLYTAWGKAEEAARWQARRPPQR